MSKKPLVEDYQQQTPYMAEAIAGRWRAETEEPLETARRETATGIYFLPLQPVTYFESRLK